MPPPRFLTFVVVSAVALTFLVLSLSSTSRKIAAEAAQRVNVPELPDALKHLPSLDHIPHRFSWHQSGHKPPTQKNSTSGEAAWYSDWRWLNPFSSSVTLDEDRAVLPPLPDRPYVYTYYETDSSKDKETQKVDDEILLTWRRAWWAAGFRPVVLTQAEATSNPLFRELRLKGVPKALEYEFSRWLAWERMGTGLLANFYCLPMAAYDDDLLSHLRRGNFAQLTRFDGLGSGLFAGEKKAITAAIQEVFKDARLSTYHSVMDAIENKEGTFRVEQPTALAYYDTAALEKHYSAIADSMLDSPNKGRLELNKLMILHLHNTWQNAFSGGIEVLKPLPAHTSALIEPGLHLAQLLAECPPSILPSSCPPNHQRCTPCVSQKTRITKPEAFSNKSSVYTISTVPHPYTMLSLNNATSDITVRHIRRNTDRDAWITAITRRVLGDGRGGPSRLIAIKDAVASEFGSSRSLWFTVESFPARDFFSPDTEPEKTPSNDVQKRPEAKAPFPENWLEEVDWHFGFPISRTSVSHGESMNPVPLKDRWQKGQAGIPADRKKSWDVDDPTYDEKSTELALLRKARETIKSKDKQIKAIRDVAEKWNLADLEAWRFVRAYRAREVIERKLFEEEESKFSGSGGRKSRWW